MSGAGSPGPGGSDGAEEDRPQEAGTLRPTPVLLLVQVAVAGVVLGWVVRPVYAALDAHPPIVTWSQPVALGLVAVLLAGTAWLTHRAVHVHRRRLVPHQAVNRLLLARACALVGALVGGAYAGYALGQLGLSAELAGERLTRSALAALACVGVCAAALLLERACRVRSDPEPP